MTTIAIDCSTRWTNLGIACGGKIRGEFNMALGRRQSELLPLLVDYLMSTTDLTLGEIDSVAVTSGPGYFTGIRVGLSYACALAEGLGKRVIALDSLLCLAVPFLNGPRNVLSAIRARRGYVYFSVISGSFMKPVCVLPPKLASTSELFEVIRENSRIFAVADDDDDLVEEIRGLGIPGLVRSSIRGGWVALIGEEMREKSVNPEKIRGIYLRDPDIGRVKIRK